MAVGLAIVEHTRDGAIGAGPREPQHHEPLSARSTWRQLGALSSALARALKTTISLRVRGSQTSNAMHIDQTLPGEEFLDRQHVPLTGLI
jgi:hypothetical protein